MWPLLTATAVLIMLSAWSAMWLQTTAAGFLNGESLWSKAQIRSTVELYAYANTGEFSHLRAFRRHFAVIRADREGRIAIQRNRADRNRARLAFLRGGVEAGAIPGVLFVLRHLPGLPYIHSALADWQHADARLATMPAIAGQLQHLYATPRPSGRRLRELDGRILAIDADVAPLARHFSHNIVEAAHVLSYGIFLAVTMGAAGVLLLWLLHARRLTVRLQQCEGASSTLLDLAGDAIVLSREPGGRVLNANAAATLLTGREVHSLQDMTLTELLQVDARSGGHALLTADGDCRQVDVRSSLIRSEDGDIRLAVIRDSSELKMLRGERHVAQTVFRHMGEGVAIADADGRICAVNRAYAHLTGYDEYEAIGLELGDNHRLGNGQALMRDTAEALDRDGHWSGCVESRRKDGSYAPERLTLIRTEIDGERRCVAVFQDLSETLAQRRELDYLLNHDALTGLVNRTGFESQCSAALQAARDGHDRIAVLFVDVDGFKAINDAFGRAAGDRFLILVADRIRNLLRSKDIAARIGGDEFTLLVNVGRGDRDAAAVASYVLHAFDDAFPLNGRDLRVSASVGVAVYPEHGNHAAELITHADAAMYTAKTGGRNAYRIYHAGMRPKGPDLYGMSGDLRRALARGQLHLMFQPCHELGNGRIIAVESLLRWRHPERGDIEPSEFIPVAESTGAIHDIGRWVMRQACAQAVNWTSDDGQPLRIAVNVSARTFGHPDFVDSVRETLKTTGLPAERLVLEITESAILHLGERTHQALEALHALGVSLAVDDFGTGYSSLTYLKLPGIAYLKIDRSFVAGVPTRSDDCAIAEAVLALARALDLTAIAEGIETPEQLRFLRGVGCAVAQGFLLSRPMPAENISALLEAQREQA